MINEEWRLKNITKYPIIAVLFVLMLSGGIFLVRVIDSLRDEIRELNKEKILCEKRHFEVVERTTNEKIEILKDAKKNQDSLLVLVLKNKDQIQNIKNRIR